MKFPLPEFVGPGRRDRTRAKAKSTLKYRVLSRKGFEQPQYEPSERKPGELLIHDRHGHL